MTTDWANLGKKIGSLREEHSDTSGEEAGQKAIEELFGDEWIAKTVEHAISWLPGRELAMNCLRLMKSPKAAQYAYQMYKTSDGERAGQAVWLIKHLCNPVAMDWVEEFMNDRNVAEWGIGVLDQLLWNNQIEANDRVEQLLNKADGLYDGALKPKADFIREYMQKRAGIY